MLADKNSLARTSNILVIFALFFVTASSTLHAASDPCTTVIPLTAGDAWRDPGRGVADSVCFDLDVDRSGIVALDLISAIAPQVRLVFDGPGRLRQTPTTLVASVEPGIVRVRVDGEDPRRPLPSFRLETRFAAAVAKSETDGETELDPDPFAGCGAKSETDGETELDPDPFAGCGAKSETDGETELDPDPFTYDLSRIPASLRPHLAEICRQGPIDDHGDGFLCATALGTGETTGEIANGWGDDVDVFRFRVKTMASIAIDLHADSELVVELYDRHGLPIGAVGRDRPRLVRTLISGTYFVRLRGVAEGRYSLKISRAVEVDLRR
jgi:hypothetical protein